MKVIGLTGGIASGKSTVSKIISEFGIPIIDADKVSREIVQAGKPAHNDIVDFFGKEVLNENGELKRNVLAQIVFKDKNKLEILNNITHPRIIQEIANRIEMYRKKNIPAVILDAPLLIETDAAKLVDEVWLIIVDEKKQIERIIMRDKISEEEAMARISSQLPNSEKKNHADVIIENNGDVELLRTKIRKLLVDII